MKKAFQAALLGGARGVCEIFRNSTSLRSSMASRSGRYSGGTFSREGTEVWDGRGQCRKPKL
jgi:hypothetical protein